MITSLTIWLASIIFLTFLFLSKKREMKGGLPIVRIGNDRVDAAVSKRVLWVRNHIHGTDWHKITLYLHACAERLEKYGLKIAEKAVSHFHHVKDAATGKDLQKNKGHIALRTMIKSLFD